MTLFLMLAAGVSMYHLGRHYGYLKGEVDMYKRCKSAEMSVREVFSNISKKNS